MEPGIVQRGEERFLRVQRIVGIVGEERQETVLAYRFALPAAAPEEPRQRRSLGHLLAADQEGAAQAQMLVTAGPGG
jgi:hypothetical protein